MEAFIRYNRFKRFASAMEALPEQSAELYWELPWFEVLNIYSRAYNGLDNKTTMAKYLGFGSVNAMVRWMTKNPEIWGNDRGSHVVNDSGAYLAYTDYTALFTTKLVAAHWREVAANYEKRNNLI